MVFILSLQVMEGDNKVVNLIQDWDILADYRGISLVFTKNLDAKEILR